MMVDSTQTIERITPTVIRLPLHGELRWGKASSLAEARHVLIEVRLSDGSVGYAEAPPRPTIYGETAASIVTIIEQELAPRLCGRPVQQAPERLQEIKNNHTAKGAIDMALQAALAQSAGKSLAEWLGVTAQRVKVSYILGIGEREQVLAEAQRVFEQGVRVLKVKVGRNWAEDIARILDLQELFSDRMELYADANECFEPHEVCSKLAELRDLGLLYCEEPLPVELIPERANVRAEGIIPLIADDSCFTARDLTRELAANTFDILNIKTARTGFTESRQMLERSRAAGKTIMVGSQASTGLGTIHAAWFAGLPGVTHPSELSFFLKLKEDILTRPLRLNDGYLDLADLADVTVDPALVAAATVASPY